MTRLRSVILLLAFLSAVLLLSSGAAAAATPGRPFVPVDDQPTGEVLVLFGDAAAFGPAAESPIGPAAASQVDRLSAAAGMRLSYVRPMSGGAHVFRLPRAVPVADAAAIAAAIAALPEVAHAEPSITMQISGTAAAPAAPAATTPDDPEYGGQWHYGYTPGTAEGLNLPSAWDITTGSADIVVAVLDTGIRPHADLSGRLLPGYDFVSDPFHGNDGEGQSDTDSRDADPSDPGDWHLAGQCGASFVPSSWHGTHVAGTIGANSDNNSDGAGVDWQAKLLPVRVLGRCGGDTPDIIDAIRWAAGLVVPDVPPNPNPAHVINMSLGGSGTCSALLQAAVDDAIAAGATIVVAAGNQAGIADFYQPASCNGVITVAAARRTGSRAYYTNYGSVVDVTAPGGEVIVNSVNGILSTLNDGATTPGDDILAYYQGTSMAAPHVSGLASLMLSVNPALTPAQIGQIIEQTAREFPAGSNCTVASCGEGLADAYAALSAISPDGELVTPMLQLPPEGAMLDTGTPMFKWSAVGLADGYALVVATDDAFVDAVIDTTVTKRTFTPPAPLDDGTYFWRVNAFDGEGSSPWSETRSFTIDTAVVECDVPVAPELITPGDGAATTVRRPTFMWYSAIETTTYELKVDDNQNLNTPVLAITTSETQHEAADDLLPDTYYWAVRGVNQSGECDVAGEWSETWSFTVLDDSVECATPPAPQLAAPADGAMLAEPPALLDWLPAADTTRYFVLADDDPDLSSPLLEEFTAATDFEFDEPLSPGVYYWAVVGLNESGPCNVEGELSEVWSFTVQDEPPPVFEIYLPSILK